MRGDVASRLLGVRGRRVRARLARSAARAAAVGFALVWLIIMQPGRLRQLGRNARMLGYAYVAAILISAALRLAGFWGT